MQTILLPQKLRIRRQAGFATALYYLAPLEKNIIFAT